MSLGLLKRKSSSNNNTKLCVKQNNLSIFDDQTVWHLPRYIVISSKERKSLLILEKFQIDLSQTVISNIDQLEIIITDQLNGLITKKKKEFSTNEQK